MEVIDDFDTSSSNGPKFGLSLIGRVQVGDEKLETKTMSNCFKQLCCKGKEQGDTAVGQEALASPMKQDYCGNMLTAICHVNVSVSCVESGASNDH